MWENQFLKINTLQFTICKYNCIMPCHFLVLAAHRLRQNLLSLKAGSSDHNSLVQMQWIFDLIRIFPTQRLMKWIINENSIGVSFASPSTKFYTTNFCRNQSHAVIMFLELQVKTFFSFIIIFKQTFSDTGLSKPTCDK